MAVLARRRAGLGQPVGPGPPRLARRVHGHGPGRLRSRRGRAGRRGRPALPSSRLPGRHGRGADRRDAVRASQAAGRRGHDRRGQDGQVGWQPGAGQRPAGQLPDGRGPDAHPRPPVGRGLGLPPARPGARRGPGGATQRRGGQAVARRARVRRLGPRRHPVRPGPGPGRADRAGDRRGRRGRPRANSPTSSACGSATASGQPEHAAASGQPEQGDQPAARRSTGSQAINRQPDGQRQARPSRG